MLARRSVAAGTFVCVLALCGCDVVADRCTIRDRDERPPTAIVALQVLVDTSRTRHPSGNRLFGASVAIAPHETRTFEAHVVDATRYDFKFKSLADRGCEVESVVYADGSTWEMPSPL